jgi:nitronate monooxygenase
MTDWTDRRALDLLRIRLPLIQAPMAGAHGVDLALAVARAGGLGSLPCAMLTPEQLREQVVAFRAACEAPLNLNFFCHQPPAPDAAREAAWRERLAPSYRAWGLGPDTPVPVSNRAPFDAAFCEVVEALKPEVVSFHFGLPEATLLARVKAIGAVVLSSATTVAEARWLAARGCDAVIAQGAEAGGHRGMFLSEDVAGQVGTLALVPQVVDAVPVPVIAAGGIADGRGMAAALVLGASAVQVGTAYLHGAQSRIAPLHRQALLGAGDDATALTNVFTGRPARGLVNRAVRELGPISAAAPAFPLAGGALAPLRAAAEAQGHADFMPMWAGQALALGREQATGADAGELTRHIAAQALLHLRRAG